MGSDRADPPRRISGQHADHNLCETRSDFLLDHLARATLLITLDVELKAFVRVYNALYQQGAADGESG
jgi:hypothetical protein